MAVSSDIIVNSINVIIDAIRNTRYSGYSVSGHVTLTNAGTVSVNNVKMDFIKTSETTAVFIFTGDFSISADDTLTGIYFSLTTDKTNFNISSEYQITGSRSLVAGSYVIVARVDYSVQGVSVHSP
jgi:hypothetical protein